MKLNVKYGQLRIDEKDLLDFHSLLTKLASIKSRMEFLNNCGLDYKDWNRDLIALDYIRKSVEDLEICCDKVEEMRSVVVELEGMNDKN